MSISLAFFILASLLLWFIIGSKGRWFIKASVIALVLYSCLSINLSLDNLFGWPSNQALPEVFQVHWIKVKEPDKRTGDKGYIYVWATDLSGKEVETSGWKGLKGYFISFDNYDPSEPRAYRLEYSKERHERAEGALGALKGGGKVGGKNNGKKKGDGGDTGKGSGKNKGEGKGEGSLSRSDDIIFHDLPPTKLPDKDTE
mgnify:CR=1 FL=1